MNLTDNLKNLSTNVQHGAKNASVTYAQRLLRLVSGFFVGMVLAIIIQVFMQSGTLMLVFFTTFFTAIIYRLLRPLTVLQIFIFDIICVLIAASLRMYIMLAP
ncbi:hypothetical protein [Pseudobdellovibrio exovorus]|uniref:Uncharacterized protein n=1 Tax=Pseudobdellovibrio exovorus JSS TaxID=1184267 RepID=M4V548_9BACT|nr:hypothetical protein [Pseudobdellovibrio exovorus]AGH94308.1 hypothetical protein A11Q_88 [Pseudobdellovibrio exovorus JSS]